MSIAVRRVQVGQLETNCWIVADAATHEALVIDPGDDLEDVLDALGDARVVEVVLTHCHFDHLGAAADLLAATGARLSVHADDAAYVTSSSGTGGRLFGFDGHVAPPPDRVLVEGDIVAVGGISLRVVHTPGHTPGGISLFAEDPEGGPAHLFSGDTLFAGSVGRTDFPRGDGRALARSIAEKLAPLPEDTVVHPGHGPDSTIGRERRVNPFFPRA